MLLAVASLVGVARVAATAPKVALALDYDLDADLESPPEAWGRSAFHADGMTTGEVLALPFAVEIDAAERRPGGRVDAAGTGGRG